MSSHTLPIRVVSVEVADRTADRLVVLSKLPPFFLKLWLREQDSNLCFRVESPAS